MVDLTTQMAWQCHIILGIPKADFGSVKHTGQIRWYQTCAMFWNFCAEPLRVCKNKGWRLLSLHWIKETYTVIRNQLSTPFLRYFGMLTNHALHYYTFKWSPDPNRSTDLYHNKAVFRILTWSIYVTSFQLCNKHIWKWPGIPNNMGLRVAWCGRLHYVLFFTT